MGSRVTTRTIDYDLGAHPRLLDLRTIVAETQDIAEDAVLRINAGDNQMDGAWNKIAIIETR